MPTDWNRHYEEGTAHWDRGRETPVLHEFQERHPEIFRGRIFVPGCGLGHDARWLSNENAQVLGADIAPLAVTGARELDESGKVDFRLLDIMHPPADLQGYFDLVWEHTCLSGLDPSMRAGYAQGLSRVLAAHAVLAGVFFIQPDMAPGEPGPPFAISVQDVENLWASVGLTCVDSWVPQVAYPGREGRECAMLFRRQA